MKITSRDAMERRFLIRQALTSVMYKKGDIYMFSLDSTIPGTQYLTNGVSLKDAFSLDIPFNVNGKDIVVSEVKNYLAYILESTDGIVVSLYYGDENFLRRECSKDGRIIDEQVFFIPEQCNEETEMECRKSVKLSHLNPVPFEEYKKFKMERLTRAILFTCNPLLKESLK